MILGIFAAVSFNLNQVIYLYPNDYPSMSHRSWDICTRDYVFLDDMRKTISTCPRDLLIFCIIGYGCSPES